MVKFVVEKCLPQGDVLIPLLFLLFISNIIQFDYNSTFLLFSHFKIFEISLR